MQTWAPEPSQNTVPTSSSTSILLRDGMGSERLVGEPLKECCALSGNSLYSLPDSLPELRSLAGHN
jgi:hypothetical protein